MKIFRNLGSVARDDSAIITVGTFDGVHHGHQSILSEVKRRAKESKGSTTLITFEPHPQLVIKSRDKPDLQVLTTIEEKIEVLRAAVLDRLLVIEFTKDFAKTSSRDFVIDILLKTVGFQEIVVGHDHAFGKNREGGITLLSALGEEYHFKVRKQDALKSDGQIISSTKIRAFLKQGLVREAASALGRNYSLSGRVVKGEGRGAGLHFPTANIETSSPHKLIPADGVYAVKVELASKRYNGMMNIGYRPTFGGVRRILEVNIFEFSQRIYGETLKVEFVGRLRKEMKFSGMDALVEQLQKDRHTSLQILRNQQEE